MYKIRVEPKAHKLRPYRGLPVCLLMKDGSYRVGQLSACRKDSVVLGGFSDADHAHIASRKTARPKSRKQQARPAKPPQLFAPPPAAHDLALGQLQVGPIHLAPLPMPAPQQTEVPLRAIDSVLVL